MPNLSEVPSERWIVLERGRTPVFSSWWRCLKLCLKLTPQAALYQSINNPDEPQQTNRRSRIAIRFSVNWIGQWIGFINSANIYFIASGRNSLLSYRFLFLHIYRCKLITVLLCIVLNHFHKLLSNIRRPLNDALWGGVWGSGYIVEEPQCFYWFNNRNYKVGVDV